MCVSTFRIALVKLYLAANSSVCAVPVWNSGVRRAEGGKASRTLIDSMPQSTHKHSCGRGDTLTRSAS